MVESLLLLYIARFHGSEPVQNLSYITSITQSLLSYLIKIIRSRTLDIAT